MKRASFSRFQEWWVRASSSAKTTEIIGLIWEEIFIMKMHVWILSRDSSHFPRDFKRRIYFVFNSLWIHKFSSLSLQWLKASGSGVTNRQHKKTAQHHEHRGDHNGTNPVTAQELQTGTALRQGWVHAEALFCSDVNSMFKAVQKYLFYYCLYFTVLTLPKAHWTWKSHRKSPEAMHEITPGPHVAGPPPSSPVLQSPFEGLPASNHHPERLIWKDKLQQK